MEELGFLTRDEDHSRTWHPGPIAEEVLADDTVSKVEWKEDGPRIKENSLSEARSESTDEVTAIDLYCGAGGLSQGFDLADINVLAAFDANEVAIETYNANRVDSHGHVADLGDLTPQEAQEQYGLPDSVNIVAGGPPCQGFSTLGERNPNDEHSNQVHRFFDWVDWFQPDAFLMENVKGLTSMEDGAVLERIVETGRDLGYDVDYQVLNASHYEVAQARERLILVGSREGSWTWPEPTTPNGISAKTILDRINEIGAVWNSGDNTTPFPNHAPGNHTEETVEKWRETEFGDDVYGNYGTQIRLGLNEPARTVLASNNHFHPTIGRALTIFEQAELQSFRGPYEFKGTNEEQQRQVGNAVPPNLAMYLGEQLVEMVTSNR